MVRRTACDNQGVALLEFAMVLPALIAVIALAIDVTLCVQEREVLLRAARLGARATITPALRDSATIVSAAVEGARAHLVAKGKNPAEYSIAVHPQAQALTRTGNAPYHRIVVARSSPGRISLFSFIDAFQPCASTVVRSVWRFPVDPSAEPPQC